MKYVAITREVSSSIQNCLLTHLKRERIDLQKAREQHAIYEKTLEELGCSVRNLGELNTLPDSVFVEDTAVVTDDFAIVTRPGNPIRQKETKGLATVLKEYRTVYEMQSPGTVDGGDVLRLGKKIYIGLTARSNREGIEVFSGIAKRFGYSVHAVSVNGCLHLKTGITQIGEDALLLNKEFVDESLFPDHRLFTVDKSEPQAGNALLIGQNLIYSTSHPKTLEKLLTHGFSPRIVDVSELVKAEAGLTCCSVLIRLA
jgi:dimethylargininase